MSKICPTCGARTNVHGTERDSHTKATQHVDGGVDEFLETWDRFYCGECGETFAVRVEEEHLRHHE